MIFPFRVLDLTDHQGLLCGRILADMGFDVIKVEKPGGDVARTIGPYYHDIPDKENSLYWLAYNMNKRGITLNIENTEGQQIFRRLVRTANIVVESFPPGYMDRLSLGYDQLQEINRGLIVTSITPFGQDGPFSEYKGCDMVNVAMGGLMYITGDPDRPPLRVSVPQSYMIAGASAAMATMAAHYWCQMNGKGQHVDVSTQASVATVLANYIPLYEFNKITMKRLGSVLAGRAANLRQKTLWRCKDGYVAFFVMAGPIGKKTNGAMVEWMDAEGMAPDYLKQMDWDTFDMATSTQEVQDSIEEPISQFCLRHTKEEILEEALKRGMTILPVSEPKDIWENIQLKTRDFWVEVEHPEKNSSIVYPGLFMKCSEDPCRIRYRAPLVGEHNEEIYINELGLGKEDLGGLRKSNVI